MKTSILALVIALTFSLTATPAAAKVTAQQKCDAGKQTATAKHLQCRVLAQAKNTEKPDATKLTAALAKCDTRLEDIFAKFEGKVPEDISGMAADADQCSNYDDVENVKALNIAVSDAVSAGTCSKFECVAAPSIDCFRVGLCGTEGAGTGTYASEDDLTSGCDATDAGLRLYWSGVQVYSRVEAGELLGCGEMVNDMCQ